MTGRRVVEVVRRGRIGSDGRNNLVGVTTTSVGVSVLDEDSGQAFRCTSTLELVLPAATTDGWSLIVDADGGDVTLTAPMTINGSGSVVLLDGNSAFLYSDGSAMYARYYYSSELSGSRLDDIAAGNAVTFGGAVTAPSLTVGSTGFTAAGLALMDDADAATQRATLGIDVNLLASLQASQPANSIGTYAFACRSTAADTSFGSTVAGDDLVPTSAVRSVAIETASSSPFNSVGLATGGALAGTYRCMGQYEHNDTSVSGGNNVSGATLWLRIA